LFAAPSASQTFESALERVRQSHKLSVYGYVVMPEHVHLLLSEPRVGTLSEAIKSAEARCIAAAHRRCRTFLAKALLRFQHPQSRAVRGEVAVSHRNPVKRELCAAPEDWPWSSFRHYAIGEEGAVEIESEWTARKRERLAGTLRPVIPLPHSSQKTS
jgi:putative transposase